MRGNFTLNVDLSTTEARNEHYKRHRDEINLLIEKLERFDKLLSSVNARVFTCPDLLAHLISETQGRIDVFEQLLEGSRKESQAFKGYADSLKYKDREVKKYIKEHLVLLLEKRIRECERGVQTANQMYAFLSEKLKQIAFATCRCCERKISLDAYYPPCPHCGDSFVTEFAKEKHEKQEAERKHEKEMEEQKKEQKRTKPRKRGQKKSV